MEITLEKIIELFEEGTETVLCNGKISFKKEKVVRLQPNDSKSLKNKHELIIPRFF